VGELNIENSYKVNLHISESEKIKQIREKLKERLKSLEEKINEKALKKTHQRIDDRISAQGISRIPLKKRSFSLFDNNQNPAEISKKVKKVYERIQEGKSFSYENLE